ncbi:MAG: transcription termination/antitermination protein NusG [Clostridia bacterium]|nr:transcription termination/antitermination protein NusG [Clostridia bacterium]
MSENAELKWYVVHTYSGYENKVKANLEKSVVNNGMTDLIHEIEIPMETAVEIKNNKRKEVERKLMPSYVLVRMVMTNETWYLVRNTRGVTGFVGAGNKAYPLSDEDYQAIYKAAPSITGDIQVGDEVRILTGLFENFTGKVKAVDLENNRVQVTVSMFKQETDVELAYDEIVMAD